MATDPDTPRMRFDGLAVGFHGRALLPPIDLSIHRGEVWALVGRNGSGKTTLMRTLLGLLPPVAGRVWRAPGLVVGYVPQRAGFDLEVPARVQDLVAGGADRGWSFLVPAPLRSVRAQVERALRDTDCGDLAREPFARLSEGQKQRALVARALVGDPNLLVLDEPTSAMDPMSARRVFDLLDRLRRERDLAVILASHHAEAAPVLATHALLLDKDDGIALPGPFEEVAASREFQARYGAVMGAALDDRGGGGDSEARHG